MPFCTHCGNSVDDAAAFCRRCGARQPGVAPGSVPPPPPPAGDWLAGISRNSAATLCYIPFVGWVAALVVLASQRFRDDNLIRFHAFQGLYLFVLWLLIDLAVAPMFGFAGGPGRKLIPALLHLAVIAAWIVGLVRTASGQLVRLPFLSELADRSLAEQSFRP